MSEAKVISLLNQKGGVGKTTMAFNLAHALAQKGRRVLCIDLDPQANLTLLFHGPDYQAEYNIFHLLINSVRELKHLHSEITTSQVIEQVGEIDFIPSGQDLSGFELSVAAIKSPRQMILKNFIQKNGLRDSYDYILVDGPPTLGLIVVNILVSSDGAVIPFQPDQFSRKGLGHFHEVVDEVEEMGIGKSLKILGYIPNLVDSRRKQTVQDFELIKDDLKNYLGKEDVNFFGPFANKVQLVKASGAQRSVFDFSSKEYHEIQGQFLDMATKVMEQLQ